MNSEKNPDCTDTPREISGITSMNDNIERILWTVFGGVSVALIVATIKWIGGLVEKRRVDRVRLSADMKISGDLIHIERFGCPGLIATIKCISERPAKISGVNLSSGISGEDLLAFQQGFAFDFGHVDQPGLPDASLSTELLPLSQAETQEELKLERDDVQRFYFPIAFPALPLYLRSQSEDVKLIVTFNDGKTHTVMQGIQIQRLIQQVLDAFSELPMSCKQETRVSVSVAAKQMPDLGNKIGMLNAHPISFDRAKSIGGEFDRSKMQKCFRIAAEIMGNWAKAKVLRYVVIPSQAFDAENPLSANDIVFKIGVAEPDHSVMLDELLTIFLILSRQATEPIDPQTGEQQISISTVFTEVQASQMLKQIRMSKPMFDSAE